jgi:hypothetical protein
MLAVRVRVVADLVPAERFDYVPATPPLEGSALFSYYLECGANALAREDLRYALGRVITLRKNIIFSIKPQNHVHVSRR